MTSLAIDRRINFNLCFRAKLVLKFFIDKANRTSFAILLLFLRNWLIKTFLEDCGTTLTLAWRNDKIDEAQAESLKKFSNICWRLFLLYFFLVKYIFLFRESSYNLKSLIEFFTSSEWILLLPRCLNCLGWPCCPLWPSRCCLGSRLYVPGQLENGLGCTDWRGCSVVIYPF